MKRKYKTSRRKWYHDNDLVKALYLVGGIVMLFGFYGLVWYASTPY